MAHTNQAELESCFESLMIYGLTKKNAEKWRPEPPSPRCGFSGQGNYSVLGGPHAWAARMPYACPESARGRSWPPWRQGRWCHRPVRQHDVDHHQPRTTTCSQRRCSCSPRVASRTCCGGHERRRAASVRRGRGRGELRQQRERQRGAADRRGEARLRGEAGEAGGAAPPRHGRHEERLRRRQRHPRELRRRKRWRYR